MKVRGQFRARLTYLAPLKVVGKCTSLLFLAVCLGCGPRDAERLLQQAAGEYSAGNYDSAQEYYTLALEHDPRLAAAYLGRGKSHEQLGSLASAILDYERALELQPDSEEVKERLILALVAARNAPRALDLFSSAPPKDLTPRLLLARGKAQLQTAQVSEALADFNSVLMQEPQNVAAHFYQGMAQFELGNMAAAEESFTATIALDTSHASAYWQRGLARAGRGMTDLANNDRQKAAELDPRMSFSDSEIGKNMIESLTGSNGDDVKLEAFGKNHTSDHP